MNRVTLLVGAETRAGRAVLDRLVADGHLVVAFVEEEAEVLELESEFDPDVLVASVLDPTDPDAVGDALDLADEAFGLPNGLVLALPEEPPPPLLAGGLEAVLATVERRILGALAVLTLAAERMEDGGAIVVVAPPRPSTEVRALSDSAAGALAGFVRGAAVELAPRGLGINLIPADRAEILAAFLLSIEGRGISGHCHNS